jgi:NAD-dependent dihydropyrimidine dehydrogenase PreA subunit
MSFVVKIDFEKCTGCGECNAVCPSEVFDEPVDGKTIVARQEDCVGCQACVSACPEEAIEIIEE